MQAWFAAHKFRILLAEDGVVFRKCLTEALEKFGLTVVAASNGLEAVRIMETASCDLILMDIQMPIMDGIEATRQIRKLEKTEYHVPIIALTFSAASETEELCYDAGMDDFHCKTVEMPTLIESLKKWLLKARSRLPAKLPLKRLNR